MLRTRWSSPQEGRQIRRRRPLPESRKSGVTEADQAQSLSRPERPPVGRRWMPPPWRPFPSRCASSRRPPPASRAELQAGRAACRARAKALGSSSTAWRHAWKDTSERSAQSLAEVPKPTDFEPLAEHLYEFAQTAPALEESSLEETSETLQFTHDSFAESLMRLPASRGLRAPRQTVPGVRQGLARAGGVAQRGARGHRSARRRGAGPAGDRARSRVDSGRPGAAMSSLARPPRRPPAAARDERGPREAWPPTWNGPEHGSSQPWRPSAQGTRVRPLRRQPPRAGPRLAVADGIGSSRSRGGRAARRAVRGLDGDGPLPRRRGATGSSTLIEEPGGHRESRRPGDGS